MWHWIPKQQLLGYPSSRQHWFPVIVVHLLRVDVLFIILRYCTVLCCIYRALKIQIYYLCFLRVHPSWILIINLFYVYTLWLMYTHCQSSPYSCSKLASKYLLTMSSISLPFPSFSFSPLPPLTCNYNNIVLVLLLITPSCSNYFYS